MSRRSSRAWSRLTIPVSDEGRETVGALAALYLGNILYALERCAMTFDAAGDAEAASYYRGIARLLAEARGRETARPSANDVVEPDGDARSRKDA